MAESTAAQERSLVYTPTWALATVSAVYVVISLVLERLLNRLGTYLQKTKQKALFAALQTMKDELMVVGFISLAIGVLRSPVNKICVSSSTLNHLTPCKISEGTETNTTPTTIGRRLLEEMTTNYCKEDHEPFVSQHAREQLHIFVFVLAAGHVLYSCLTMLLALSKVYSWGKWEKEAHDAVDMGSTAELLKNIRFPRQSTLYHTSRSWSGSRFLVWVTCFFQQLHTPRSDYLTLRSCFVTTHRLQPKYDFHSYMIRCMEDEFETIVGISAWLWGFVILFLLFNVYGVNLYFWSSFIPVILVLAIGTKLAHIVATLALENDAGPHAEPFVGAISLKPRDELFWFHRPKILLYVIHLILFQNACELATFLWEVWQLGYESCLLGDRKLKAFVYLRLGVGLTAQLICSFSTLPLYALVSQMGTNPKKSIIADHVGQALQNWRKDAQKRLKIKTVGTTAPAPQANSSSEDHEDQDFMDNQSLSLKYTGTTKTNEDEFVPLNDAVEDDSPPRIDTIVTEDGCVYRLWNVENPTYSTMEGEIQPRRCKSISLPVQSGWGSQKIWQSSLGRCTMLLEMADEQLVRNPSV